MKDKIVTTTGTRRRQKTSKKQKNVVFVTLFGRAVGGSYISWIMMTGFWLLWILCRRWSLKRRIRSNMPTRLTRIQNSDWIMNSQRTTILYILQTQLRLQLRYPLRVQICSLAGSRMNSASICSRNSSASIWRICNSHVKGRSSPSPLKNPSIDGSYIFWIMMKA